MKLNSLCDHVDASRPRKRVGRGTGSGRGKTCGRGHKGQKSRTGVSIKGFEGGQMPIYMRMPKRGFVPPARKRYVELTVDRVVELIQKKVFKAGDTLSADSLVQKKVIKNAHAGVRLIGSGKLEAALTVSLAGCTAGAQKSVVDAGGSVQAAGA